MSKEIFIKGRLLSAKKPLLCVPVISTTINSIIDDINIAISNGADVIELRADFFEGLQDENKLKSLLDEVEALCHNTIVLFTIRTKNEGGNVDISDELYEKIICSVSDSGHIDMIDVEALNFINSDKIISYINSKGLVSVGSHHCFTHTYEDEKLTQTYEKILDKGASVVKVAMMPNYKSDALRLLNASEKFTETHADTPVISISMGEYGRISRVLGADFGSILSFAAIGNSSAPGQIKFEDMKYFFRILY